MQSLAKDSPLTGMVPVRVIRDEAQAMLMSDPIRREMLRLLSRQALTEKELSNIIGISPPSMDHHLKALTRGHLISVVRKEAGTRGIVQKWYRSDAQLYIVDRDRLPDKIRRYFMPMDIERTRGIMAACTAWTRVATLSDRGVESLTRQICTLITRTAQNYKGGLEDDPEKVIQRIYVDALRQLEV